MPESAAAGVVVYAKDMERLAHFYSEVLNLREQHRAADWVVLESSAWQLVVHAIPAEIAARISITQPPQRRDNLALKFFATVPSLADAAALVARLGGDLFNDVWRGPGHNICNAMDCEGNVFQLREVA